jgi:triacylglycerol esterase/lipase EstA (alpha/beta hydrolase family)
LLVAALALVVVAVAAVLLLSGEEEVPEVARGGEPLPVILVHGYGGSSASMGTIQARIEREGRPVVAVDLPNGGQGDMAESARVVADAVEATGAQQVDLIGFSMGGVVVRAYLDDFGVGKVRYVITLASPHHGTDVAGLAAFADPGACTGACEQLRPESSFLEDLNDPDETPEGPAFVTVWTEDDQTVTPPDSAELEGALNIKIQDVCPGAAIDHGDVARDPAVMGILVTTLTGRMSGPPTDCAALASLGA